MERPNITELLVVNQGRQILQSFGLNMLKQKFYSFGPNPVQDEPDGYSLLGTPVFDSVTFYGTGTNGDISYYDLGQQKTVTVPKLTIDIALITVTPYINVSKTNIVGANGSVKQFINVGDYEVEIKGVFTSETANTRPDDKIRQLHKIIRATSEINVASGFLTLFGVTCIVFDGPQPFAQDEGSRDVQKFTLNCISETPFAIKVTQQGATTSNSNGTPSFIG